MPSRLHVVAAVIRLDGRVLACRRAPGRPAAGLWEFPGGKVDPDEAPEAALRREIAEELGVEITVGSLIDRSETPVGDIIIDLACYEATLTGPPPAKSTDHDRFDWRRPRDLAGLGWATPDLPAVRMLAASYPRARVPALAGPPAASTRIPEGVTSSLADAGLAGARLRPVWRNTVGGLTFSIASRGDAGPVDFYVKWNPRGSGESLADEVDRLNWLEGHHPAPVVAFFTADRTQEILLTHALPGESAVSPRWRREPADTMRAFGVGLRRLHELPPDECPFDWGVPHRLRSIGAARESLGEAPPVDRLVVCHGDPCAPNTLLGNDGGFLAHVDLARLGTADRWADLAVMSMSLGWNYAGYDEAVFWQAYGIAPDPVRIAYYRRLWNAADEA